MRGEKAMGDVSVNSEQMRDFKLGRPALVCRWRLASGKLPLENRHLRALAARRAGEKLVSPQLVAWAKQHVEWTLRDGSAENPNGVLMLVIDDEGQAAMTVGPYEPLTCADAAELAVRAGRAADEAKETGVAPETMWAVRDGQLVAGFEADAAPSGTTSLLIDLAATKGMTITYEPGLAADVASGSASYDEVLLASDEYGIVAATDACGPMAQRLADDYARLLESMSRR